MKKRNYSISSVQLFYLIFAFVFSGLFLYASGSLISVIISCAFVSIMSVVAGALCEGFASSEEFYAFAFGKSGSILRLISLVFLVFSSVRSLSSFSVGVTSYYKGGSATAVFAVCAAISAFAVARDFTGAARFAELCAFSLAGILLLSLLGKGGTAFDFSLSSYSLSAAFDAVGCVAVIFSLYLRNITPNDSAMSDFARNVSFQPSPVLCGVFAPILAGAAYIFVNLMGADGNILVVFFVWFFALARFFSLAICASDLLGLPECIGEGKKTRRASFFALIFAVVIFLGQTVPEEIIADAGILYNVILPCSLFAGISWKEKREERNSPRF